mgnify:FL=1
MNWKTIETVKIVNRDNEVEDLHIQHDGNFYRIKNAFGNINIEFDVSSGFDLASTLSKIIESDISDEITSFLNEKDYRDSQGNADTTAKQVDLFSKVDNFNKNTKGINIKTNSIK